MKIIPIFLLSFFSWNCFAQNFKTPVEYLNYIGKETQQISNSTWIYTKNIAHSNDNELIEQSKLQLLQKLQLSSDKILALKNGYRGDLEYRNQLLAYFSLSEKYINDDFDKIINLQEVADQSLDFMETYISSRNLVNQKINDGLEKLVSDQKNFGRKYNIQMADDASELSKKIQFSNEVFKYHSQLYLIYFKVNFTDNQLSQAIKEEDLNLIQQISSTLELYSDEGLKKMEEIKPFDKDASLIVATRKALEFYKKEAIVLTPKVISFLLSNKKLEEIKESLDSKNQKDRTFQEISDYNKLVNTSNKEIIEFNKLNSKFYQDKKNVISAWQQTGTDFISKHVPKD